MDFEAFLAKQKETYRKIEEAGRAARSTGVRVDTNLTDRWGGLFVEAIPTESVARELSSVSQRVARLINAVPYGPRDIHTTIASLGYGPYFQGEVIDTQALTGLVRVVSMAVRRLHSSVLINYEGYTFTDKVVLAKGTPNEGFVRLMQLMEEEARQAGLEVVLPWGAKATVSRFMADVPAEKLSGFFGLMNGTHGPGESRMTRVRVGYSDWSKDEHYGHFRPCAGFVLP